jgi:AAA+ ATPase superfamily predicted ATPase
MVNRTKKGAPSFVGRKEELKELELLFKKRTASLVVIQGKRRIGKSRLVREFGKNKQLYIFSGIPLTPKTTAQSQRDEFARQLEKQLDFPALKADNWRDLFGAIAKLIGKSKVVVLLDEISWLGSKDPDFLGKLKNAWDIEFSQNPGVMLILCGSVSSWIEKNILSSTGFVGRISSLIKLKELSARDCNQLLTLLGCHFSAYDTLKLLSVMGGILKYIEEIQSSLTADENIKRLYFRSGGQLFLKFDQIFSDLFSTHNQTYKKIVQVLASGAMEYNDICKALKVTKSGLLSSYLDDLIQAGFIRRDYTWHLKTGQASRLSHYRLSDNYVRFYLRCIDKNSAKISADHFKIASISSLPGWDRLMGYQFENLVLNNRDFIFEKLSIRPEEIVADNPFFQRKTARTPGCQIDYLIQTKFNSLFICEIKYSRQGIKPAVINEVKEKIDTLTKPKGFSCFPVLIHVNELHDKVSESDYFMNTINFEQLLM